MPFDQQMKDIYYHASRNDDDELITLENLMFVRKDLTEIELKLIELKDQCDTKIWELTKRLHS